MMKKIEHLGIAVADIDKAEILYSKIFGMGPYKRETVLSQNVITSFFKVGPNKIELVAPLDGQGPIQQYLDKRGEGFHHVAYAVDNIIEELKRMKAEGFRLIHEEPVTGADNKIIAFVHPKSTSGTLIELCQERPD